MEKKDKYDRKILILSDGKPGHFNQSLGIVDRLPEINFEIVQVRYKKKWRDNIIRVITFLFGRKRLDDKFIKNILKWGLDEQSFRSLFEAKEYDVVLSTGSSVSAPNLLISKLANAKSVVCTRPSPLGFRHFDLAILPEHSRPRKIAENVLMTFGVPNRITPESVLSIGKELFKNLIISQKPVIGVLLGGDDPYYYIPANLANDLCDILLSLDVQIALTTSRRTSNETDKVLRSRLNDNPSCCLLVIANDESPPNTVSGILGISDVVIVTEDSFSMVCESASSGKKVIILNVMRKGKGNPKRERVYQMLADKGFVKRTNLDNLHKSIIYLLSDDKETMILNDAHIASDGIRKLFFL
jgi:hypothetical protein